MNVGDRVEVFWSETDSWFPATIVEPEGNSASILRCCDVIYDELVDGNSVRERHVSADRLRCLVQPDTSAARHSPSPADGTKTTAVSPVQSIPVAVNALLSNFLSELSEVTVEEGEGYAANWFISKPLAERTSLIRIAASVSIDSEQHKSLLLRFLLNTVVSAAAPEIGDKKAFVSTFSKAIDSNCRSGGKPVASSLTSAEECQHLRECFFSGGGGGVPLGELEIYLRASVLVIDAELLAYRKNPSPETEDCIIPSSINEDVLENAMLAAFSCISYLKLVGRLPTSVAATSPTTSVVNLPDEQLPESEMIRRPRISNKTIHGAKRIGGEMATPGQKDYRKQKLLLASRFLVYEMARHWLGPLCLVLGRLTALFSQRCTTRYLTGSDRLAISASKLSIEVIALDYTHCETARTLLDVASVMDNRVTISGFLGRMQDSALGLLKLAFVDNPLIGSTLMADLLPLLLESYVSSPLAPPTAINGKGGQNPPLSAAQTYFNLEGPPIPLSLIALVTIMQSSLIGLSDSAKYGSDTVDRRNNLLLESNTVFADGSQRITFFISNLMKRCFSPGNTRSGMTGSDPMLYRSLMTRILSDLLRLLDHPQCPVAAVVVGLFGRKFLGELSCHCNLVTPIGSTAGLCKNINYAMFVLDLIGVLGTHVCSLCSSTNGEKKLDEMLSLPVDVLTALKSMYGLCDSKKEVKVSNCASAAFLREVAMKDALTEMPVVVIHTAKNLTDACDINARGQDNNCEREIAKAASVLALLVEITSAGLDIITQRLPKNNTDLVTIDADSNSSSAINTVLPPAWQILAQCGLSKDIMSTLGYDPSSLSLKIKQHDVNMQFVFDHLMHIEYHHLINRHISDDNYSLDGESYLISTMAADNVSLFLQLQLRSYSSRNSNKAPGSPLASCDSQTESVLYPLVFKRAMEHYELLEVVGKGGAYEIFKERTRLEHIYQEYSWRARYSSQWTHRCYRHIIVHQYLDNLFDKITNLLCIILSQQQSPQLRAKVLKILGMTMKIDQELFRRPNLQHVVCERFNDASIMVREEAIKLVGANILQNGPDVVGQVEEEYSMSWYIDGLLVRLRDKGVSVRKTVVNILTSVLFNQPWHPRYSQICLCLLQVAAIPTEESSVKDSIRSALHRVWFSSPVLKGFPCDAALNGWITPTGGAKIYVLEDETDSLRDTNLLNMLDVSCNKLNDTEKLFVKLAGVNSNTRFNSTATLGYTDIAAMQIVDVIYRAGNDTSWLVSMLRDVLHGGSLVKPIEEKGDAKRRRDAAREHCDLLLRSLTEALLRVEESDTVFVERLIALKRSGSEQVVSIIAAISAFCEAHPPFLMPHLDTVLPYLKKSVSDQNISTFSPNKSERDVQVAASSCSLSSTQYSTVGVLIMQMISGAVPVEGPAFTSRAGDLCLDLCRICLTGNIENVHAATKCLARLARFVTKDLSLLEKLSKKCFTAVFVIAQQGQIPTNHQLGLLQRSIIVLGALCEQVNSIQEVAAINNSLRKKIVEIESSNLLSRIDSKRDDILHASIIDTTAYVYLEERVAKMDIRQVYSVVESNFDAICGTTFAAIRFLLSPHIPSNDALRKRAAQALCSVFVGCSRLIIVAQTEHMLQRLLSDEFSDSVHELFLSSLGRMMVVEEHRLETVAANDSMKRSGLAAGHLGYVCKIEDSVSKTHVSALGEEVAASDVDSTVSGSILQQHLNEICIFLGHSNVELRIVTVDLVGVLLRQGMICPLDVISLLIGLQGDISEDVQRRALQIIQLEDTKNSSFLENRLCEGIEKIPILQRLSANKIWAVQLSSSPKEIPISVIGSLYSSCFRTNRKRRTIFLTALLRRCDIHCNVTDDAKNLLSIIDNSFALSPNFPTVFFDIRSQGSNDLSCSLFRIKEMVEFLVSTLAHIPYSVLDEVLFVITWLNRKSAVQTDIFLKRFRDLLLLCGAIIGKQGCIQSPMEGDTFSIASNQDPSEADISENTTGSFIEECLQFDEETFQIYEKSGNCVNLSVMHTYTDEATCRQRLILLGHYLKNAYHISSSVCAAYASEGRVQRHTKKRHGQAAKIIQQSGVNEDILFGEGDTDLRSVPDSSPAILTPASKWEAQVCISDYGINHPYAVIQQFERGAEDNPDIFSTEVDTLRHIVRKGISVFNKLLSLQINGIQNERCDQHLEKLFRADNASPKLSKRKMSKKRKRYTDDSDYSGCES